MYCIYHLLLLLGVWPKAGLYLHLLLSFSRISSTTYLLSMNFPSQRPTGQRLMRLNWERDEKKPTALWRRRLLFLFFCIYSKQRIEEVTNSSLRTKISVRTIQSIHHEFEKEFFPLQKRSNDGLHIVVLRELATERQRISIDRLNCLDVSTSTAARIRRLIVVAALLNAAFCPQLALNRERVEPVLFHELNGYCADRSIPCA